MSDRLDYQAIKNTLIVKNREALMKNPNTPEVRFKVRAHLQRHCLPDTDADVQREIARIPTDPFLASMFIKDPVRQSFHQKACFAFLKKSFADMKVLEARGPKSLFIQDGIVVSGANRSFGHQGKSIDFQWTHRGKTIYALHKYTEAEGGGQDNQYADAKHFMINAALSKDENALFLAICDGDYYQRRREPNALDLRRIDVLNKLGNGKNSFALTVNDVQDFLNNHLQCETSPSCEIEE